MSISMRFGEAYGLPIMKFTLTYDGELPPSGNSGKNADKWRIRKELDPQLRELWRIHPALKKMLPGRFISPAEGAFFTLETHHQYDPPLIARSPREGEIDLCAPVSRGGRFFKPLVRDSFALVCALKILFLRKEDPGRVYQGGDLDNRIKTLLDALSVPENDEQVIQDPTTADPIFCLLEKDSLVTGVNVESERLLTAPNAPITQVRLIIEVD